jgi:hypothetical protein
MNTFLCSISRSLNNFICYNSDLRVASSKKYSVAQNSNSRCQPKNIFHRLSSSRTIFSIVSNHRIMSEMDAQLDILRPGTPNADTQRILDIVDQPQVSYQLHLLFFSNLASGADDNHVYMDDRLRSLIQSQSVQLLKLNPTKLIPRTKFL